MTSPLGLIRMLMWHHGGMIRGTWHVLAACWRALDGCQHIQARGEHMKTREKEGRHSAGAWKRVTTPVVTPAARGKEGILSDGAWKSVKALMMKISPGTDRSGDVLHRSGVRFSSLKPKKEVWQAVQFYCSYLRRGERKGFLYLLVAARGLLGSVGSEDTWCVNNPSPGRSVLVGIVVLCDVHGLGSLDSWRTPVVGGESTR
uniref:Uncharacterized protein n=1 Tax=Fagus sylvatica TaxID=28930 RepID=A0A2N9GJ72_FAGSY